MSQRETYAESVSKLIQGVHYINVFSEDGETLTRKIHTDKYAACAEAVEYGRKGSGWKYIGTATLNAAPVNFQNDITEAETKAGQYAAHQREVKQDVRASHV